MRNPTKQLQKKIQEGTRLTVKEYEQALRLGLLRPRTSAERFACRAPELKEMDK